MGRNKVESHRFLTWKGSTYFFLGGNSDGRPQLLRGVWNQGCEVLAQAAQNALQTSKGAIVPF
jgi:hypothetical protein